MWKKELSHAIKSLHPQPVTRVQLVAWLHERPHAI